MIATLLSVLLAGGTAAETLAGGPTSGLHLTEVASPAGPATGMPSLTRGADGRVYLTWVERRGKGQGTLWFATWEGEAWSAARTVAQGDDWFLNWADFPSVAALEDGTLAAHWLRATGQGHGYGVELALSRDGGTTWSAPRWLHEDRKGPEYGFVSLAPLGPERFGALWLDGRDARGESGSMALLFRTIDADGTFGEETVLDLRACDCCPTTLARLESGQLFAAYRDRTEDEVRDISFLRRIGGEWSKPLSAHEDGWRIAGCPVNGPRMVASQGNVALAWYTGADESTGQVLFSTYDADGRGFGLPKRVDDGSPEGRVDVAFLPDGSPVVSWLEHESGAAAWRVRRVRPGIVTESSLLVAEVPSERATGSLRMAAADDAVLLAWTAPEDPRRVVTARLSVEP